MSEILGLEHLGLRHGGSTLTLSVPLGQSLAIVGPAGSGKSFLLRTVAGLEIPIQGSVHIRGRVSIAGSGAPGRRTKVQSMARRSTASLQRATEALSATRLWEYRNAFVADLTPSQAAAAELLECFSAESELVFIDGQLDILDPWTLESVLGFIRSQMGRGRTFVVATNRTELIPEIGSLIILNDLSVRFAGSVEDLLRAGPPHTLDVYTDNDRGVRAIVSPFEVRISPFQGGLRMEASQGQELAAKLLAEGYGDVRFVIVRPPTVQEALQTLLRR
jgi:ABC-type multidrug transport system ATPase subunit